MYYPTSRVLTVLEMLQTYSCLSGPTLAARLEVDVRTIRRYILRLQELGIPVETLPGRHGGYRLRPGYRLPPMMFNDEEAIVLGLGLTIVQKSGLAGATAAANGALAKLLRVMPGALREQVVALQASLAMDAPVPDFEISSEVFGVLSTAIAKNQTVRLAYRQPEKPLSHRLVNPYGLVCHEGRWYLVGYCQLRADLRVFRLDRLAELELEKSWFEPPPNFDCLKYAVESFAAIPDEWDIAVLLETTLGEIRSKVPLSLAILEPRPEGVLLRAAMPDLDWMSRFLVGLGCRFKVQQPTELCTALERLAQEISQIARLGYDITRNSVA